MALGDLSAALSDDALKALGLPKLDKEEIPTCGMDTVRRACTREGTATQDPCGPQYQSYLPSSDQMLTSVKQSFFRIS